MRWLALACLEVAEDQDTGIRQQSLPDKPFVSARSSCAPTAYSKNLQPVCPLSHAAALGKPLVLRIMKQEFPRRIKISENSGTLNPETTGFLSHELFHFYF